MRIAWAVMLLTLLGETSVASAQTRYAVLIGGLGGSPAYTETFRQYLFESRKALVEQLGFLPAHVVVLAEPASSEQDFVTDVSTAENIRAQFARLAGRVTEDDQVYVLLFGHGSYDGTHARLNLPRRDLDDVDYAALLDALPAGRIVFVNTASASGPFVEALSAPGRIIITATRAGTQRNETVFPQFWVEALSSPVADLDKDGVLSVRETFAYAVQRTEQSFDETSHLATEHALLEDTGDGEGYRLDELEAAGEGNLALVTYLKQGEALVAASAGGAAAGPFLQEKTELEREIAALKSRKPQLAEDAYYAQLETLFVRLARLNNRIEGEQP